jgi:hypothetical protein
MDTDKNTGNFTYLVRFVFIRVYLSRGSLDEGGFVVKMDISFL